MRPKGNPVITTKKAVRRDLPPDGFLNPVNKPVRSLTDLYLSRLTPRRIINLSTDLLQSSDSHVICLALGKVSNGPGYNTVLGYANALRAAEVALEAVLDLVACGFGILRPLDSHLLRSAVGRSKQQS